ncbi:MAG: chromosome segregation protein SMC [Gammaproteobacteria bacterium]|nr:chromosome segregation protein SMC [Gammaproteobacteria bacterium]
MTDAKLSLKSIKLVGFKSFVDPTTVAFPGHLTAVVGPNGCGKSNIIDAVRWVMGESSAKQLRGEGMADVIFNGSTARKPIGQASVELLFNNPQGALGGEYAQYPEIAIKRLVTREGQSTYFLNNVRCRRRDILDIFLGTGMGPRSYAIIEQGMISRLIEAKPEELRVYLEEAAGISKYKERRRETENRIRHTRENLDRLNDLREELDKQLQRLERQSANAQRYQEFKSEEDTLRAQLLTRRLMRFTEEGAQLAAAIRDGEVALESEIAALREVEKLLEIEQDHHSTRSDALNETQATYYTAGAEVTRIEQAIEYQKERREQWQDDLESTETSLQETQEHQQQDTVRIQWLTTELAEVASPLAEYSEQAEKAAQRLGQVEQAFDDWQQQWDSFNQLAAQSMKEAEVEQTRIRHLEGQQQTSRNRIERLETDNARLSEQTQSAHSNGALEPQIQALEQQKQSLEAVKVTQQTEAATLREQRQALGNELDTLKTELRKGEGQLQSLQTLQQAGLGLDNTQTVNWLKEQGFADNARLAQVLRIEEDYETALETILGEQLQAVCISNVDDLHQALSHLPPHLQLLYPPQIATTASLAARRSLVSYLKSGHEWAHLLQNIEVVDDVSQGLALLKTAAPELSFITQEGIWISQHGIRVPKAKNGADGVLKREGQIKALQDSLKEVKARIIAIEETITEVQAKRQNLQVAQEESQRNLQQLAQQIAEARANLKIEQNRLEQLKQRVAQNEKDKLDEKARLESFAEDLNAARHQWQEAMTAMESQASTRQSLLVHKEELQQQVQSARVDAKMAHDTMQSLRLKEQSLKSELDAKTGHLQRTLQQLKLIEEKHSELQRSLSNSVAPLEDLQQELQEALAARVASEEALQGARAQLEAVEFKMRELTQNRHTIEDKVEAVRSQLEKHRLEKQTTVVRLQTLQEQIDTHAISVEATQPLLDPEMTEPLLEEALQKVSDRIQRLGAINLAAIEEYQSESERKIYLDKQNADLVEALSILEDAIQKIDRETKSLFKDTFDKVNHHLQQLFPKIFGGGECYLEATGEELLDMGVTIMARPPGKRNATIHLLSGGEKALTAIALVFAIFKLNPAPFCMLDEVDAPLDDNNVFRYCNLVKEMSKELQFIYISHNKLAMEMAESLIGVTMKEPGVSRLVSVDMEEALAMAED